MQSFLRTQFSPFLNFQPPVCDENGENTLKRRRKRQTIEQDETSGNIYDDDRENLKVKVFSGLYVNEATDEDDALTRFGGDAVNLTLFFWNSYDYEFAR